MAPCRIRALNRMRREADEGAREGMKACAEKREPVYTGE